MKLDLSDNRKATTSAISAGSAMRPISVSAMSRGNIRVRRHGQFRAGQAGATQLTLTLKAANAWAQCLVNEFTAAFVVP